jgi:hypothetical protein
MGPPVLNLEDFKMDKYFIEFHFIAEILLYATKLICVVVIIHIRIWKTFVPNCGWVIVYPELGFP